MLIQPGETPESISMRRKLAAKLMEEASSTAPVQHWLQGANRIAQGLMGGYEARKAGEAEDKATSEGSALLAQLVGGGDGVSPSAGSGGPVIPPAPAPASPATASAAAAGQATGPTMGGGGGMDAYKGAVASIETPGFKDPYRAVGPVTRTGDRAYGKYQVMGDNIPSWTREAIGREMTPQEFRASPEAQEKVFEAKFGSYVQKYGNPQDAASAWFTGKPASVGANRRASNPDGSPLGIKGSEYVQKFSSALGGGTTSPAGGGASEGGAGGNSRLALAARMMGNERTRPIGQAVLTSELTKERQGPKIVELELGGGQKVSAQQMPDGTLRPIDTSQFGGQNGQLPPNFQDTQKLRKEFQAQKNVAKYTDSIGPYESMIKSAPIDTATADVDMVYGYATILDPESVVREGEYATIAGNQSIPDRLKGEMLRAMSGQGRLRPETRAEIMKIAGNRVGTYRDKALADKDRFGKYAKRYGMDEALIGQEFPELPVYQPAGPAGGAPKPSGPVIQWERGPDGKPRRVQASGG